MTKKELRNKYLELRKEFSREEVNRFSAQIFENFISKFQVSDGQKVNIFITIAKFNEINTFPFIKYFREKNVQLYVPKIYNNQMISLEFTPETKMEVSDWGIAEPLGTEDCGVKNYDFVITPLLYCDEKGNRVGYGKGYYDRFFSEINPNALKIGVGYFNPDENVEDFNDKDIPLDYLVTPDTILSFNGLL